MTNASPALLVRMLGSAALALPGSSRLGLNIGGAVLAADAGTCPSDRDATTSTAAARPRRITRAFILFPPDLPEVVATDAVDLERHRVRLRSRVVLRALLDRGRKRVRADRFEQALPRHAADVGGPHVDGQRARPRGRAADRAGLRHAGE